MSRIVFLGIVEAVVGFGQALVVLDHKRCTEFVIVLAGGFEELCGTASYRGTGKSRSNRKECSGGHPSWSVPEILSPNLM